MILSGRHRSGLLSFEIPPGNKISRHIHVKEGYESKIVNACCVLDPGKIIEDLTVFELLQRVCSVSFCCKIS